MIAGLTRGDEKPRRTRQKKSKRAKVDVHKVAFPKEPAVKDTDGHHLAQRFSTKEYFSPA